MRDHSSHIEVSRERAIQLLLDACEFETAVETVSIAEANGRVLAEDAVAQLDMPNCLTCNMDSVAVRWADFEAGVPDTSEWTRGVQWEFANTGIGMPEGFDTAIVIENVEISAEGALTILVPPSKQFAGTSKAGSRMRAGKVLVEAGETLTPLLVSRVASGNNAEVRVLAKPVVAFIPTGNELVKPGETVARGKNIETNSLICAGKVEAWGGICKVWDIVPDDPAAIKEAVVAAAAEADIVVLNAGSSKGSDDWNVEMLEDVGRVLYHQVTHGPAHHCSGAVVNGTPVVGISGPAGGAAFAFDFYLYPVIQEFLGQPTELGKFLVRLAEPFPVSNHGEKTKGEKGAAPKGEQRPDVAADAPEFFSVKQLRLTQEDGSAEMWAVPAGSTHLTPNEAEEMDCYYLLNKSAAELKFGDIIEVDVRP